MLSFRQIIEIHKRMQNDKSHGAMEGMSARASPNFAFILSLVGGLVIVLLSLISVFLVISESPYTTLYGIEIGLMHVLGLSQGWLIVFSIVAVVCGTIVVAGAIMLNAHPAKHFACGITVLVFSIASFIGGGGLFIGALLGMLGGFLSIITSKTSGVFLSPRM
jgi:hypothetical protein